jgi:nitroreductase
MLTGMQTSHSLRAVLDAPLAPEASIGEVVRWAIAHACLAPSELNTQPWLFRVEIHSDNQSATVELLLDESRLLPTIDPANREAVLACGAALLNLRLALQGASIGTRVLLCPDPARPGLLARLDVQGPCLEPVLDRTLREAIPFRGTHRAAFDPGEVPAPLVDHLVAEAAYEGAIISVLDADDRVNLAELTADAERRLWLNSGFRREVAAWSRSNNTSSPDGIPGFARGLNAWQSWLEPTRTRRAHLVPTAMSTDGPATDQAPLLLVVGAAQDTREALLRAGAGMQRLLLSARSHGLAASYLNATLHVEDLRHSLGRAVRLDHPQVVLRLGYASDVRPTPRRPESAVLDLR